MSIGTKTADYNNYFMALKGNYRKGTNRFRTILANPATAEEYSENLGGCCVVLGWPIGEDDRNSQDLLAMLKESTVISQSVLTWLGQWYSEYNQDADMMYGDAARCAELEADPLMARAVSMDRIALGKLIVTLSGGDCADYADINAVVSSTEAMTAVAAAPAAMQALIVNADAITAAAASETAYQAIFANAEALGAVVASKPAMEAMIASPSALSAMVASEPVMQAIIANSTALNVVVSSSVAMRAVAANAVAMGVIVDSQTAMTAVAASSTAMTAVAASQTAMTAVAASSTAMAAVVAAPVAVKAIVASSVACSAVMSAIQSHRSALLTTLGKTAHFRKVTKNLGDGSGTWTDGLNAGNVYIPTACYDDGDTAYSVYYQNTTTSICSVAKHSGTSTITSGVSLRGVKVVGTGSSQGYVSFDIYTPI